MRIGLTGGIGTGKSTVAEILRSRGFEVLDADQIGREIVEPGSRILRQLEEEFGSGIIQRDGSLDRQRLSAIVFADEEKLRFLNKITHKEIARVALMRMADSTSDPVFFDAPLLFESGLDQAMDQNWVVTADPELRISRVMERDGVSREEVRARIRSQMDEGEKQKKADWVIENSGTQEELARRIDEILDRVVGVRSGRQNPRDEAVDGTNADSPWNFREWRKNFIWTGRHTALAIGLVAVILGSLATIHFLRGGGQDGLITENGITYQTADTVDLPMSQVKTFNPTISTDQDTYYLARLIYDGLFELDETMRPKENLVEDYTINKGSHSITMDLIQTHFHDGEDLTAEDVEYTVTAMKAGGKNQYREQLSNIASVEVQGKRKLTVYFVQGTRMSLSYLTFPILPAGQYNGAYDVIYRTSFKPVGTGPYRCTKSGKTTGMTLKPYSDYHGEKARSTITVMALSKEADRYKMTEASNISLNFTRSISREAKVTQKDTELVDFPANQVEYIGFNFLKSNMADANIRKAIACAIDNKSIIQECYYNSGMLNDTIFYPEYMGVGSKQDAYPYSQDDAEDYLKKAGYKDRDNDGLVEDENYGELAVTILSTQDKRRQSVVEKIIDDLEEVGIVAYPFYVAESGLESAMRGTGYDIFLAGMKYTEVMDLGQLLTGTPTASSLSQTTSQDQSTQQDQAAQQTYSSQITGKNYTRYYNKQVNTLVEEMDAGQDSEAMTTSFETLREILIEDLPYYCLLYRTYGVERAPALQGDVKPLFWNIYHGADQWYSRYEVTEEEEGEEEN